MVVLHGIYFLLSGAVLVITSVALLIYAGQQVRDFNANITYTEASFGYTGALPPVVRLILYNQQTVLVAYWPLILALLSGVFSLALMMAAMFFRGCGHAKRRSRLQYRYKRIYPSEIVLALNALLATTAFLATTILHAVTQSLPIDFPVSDPNNGLQSQAGNPQWDVESWACLSDVSVGDMCMNGPSMRITLIPHFVAAWLIVFIVAWFLRSEEGRTFSAELPHDEETVVRLAATGPKPVHLDQRPIELEAHGHT